MSSGPADANAVGELSDAVEFAAMDLRDAIHKAKQGYRGLSPAWLAVVNEVLSSEGVVLLERR